MPDSTILVWLVNEGGPEIHNLFFDFKTALHLNQELCLCWDTAFMLWEFYPKLRYHDMQMCYSISTQANNY